MVMKYLCTRCNLQWDIEEQEGSVMASCPICAQKEIRRLKEELSCLQDLMRSYRNVFEDIGVKSISINNNGE